MERDESKGRGRVQGIRGVPEPSFIFRYSSSPRMCPHWRLWLRPRGQIVALGVSAPSTTNAASARFARRNDPRASESKSCYRSLEASVPPKSMIVDGLQGLVHFTSSLGTLRMPGGCLELPTVESRFWLESEGWSYSPPKAEREVAPQRDEVWLKGTGNE